MSLQHVLRAEKLAEAEQPDPTKLKRIVEGPNLSDIKSDAGCNMLQVYLLHRWGRIFGSAAMLKSTEDFQNEVVDAYVAAGCAVDEAVSSRKFGSHGGPNVSYGQIAFSGKLSALGIIQSLRDQFSRDIDPELYDQLERLEKRLGQPGGQEATSPASRGLDEARAVIIRGARMTLPAGAQEIQDYRAVASALGLQVVICADEANIRPSDDVEVLIGIEVATASSEDDAPTLVATWPDLTATQERYLLSLAAPGLHLGAYGPLATAYLVDGILADDGPPNSFFVGASVDQTPQAQGASGDLMAKAFLGAASFDPADTSLILIARYD